MGGSGFPFSHIPQTDCKFPHIPIHVNKLYPIPAKIIKFNQIQANSIKNNQIQQSQDDPSDGDALCIRIRANQRTVVSLGMTPQPGPTAGGAMEPLAWFW